MPAIEVVDLIKEYPLGNRAVSGITFNVEMGELFGFIGPNGAGKTTTIRILATLLEFTSGSVSVLGFNPRREARMIRSSMGYAAQMAAVDSDLNCRENLIMRGRLYGMTRHEAKVRAQELLAQFSLGEVEERRAAFLSGGMKRRLDLALALAHRPKLLFLDEPTTGLDPQSRLAMWRALEVLNQEGTTIFLTTQNLEEADKLCGRIVIIDHGKVIVEGSPDNLRGEFGGQVVSIECDEKSEAVHIVGALERMGLANAQLIGECAVSALMEDSVKDLARVTRYLNEQGLNVATIGVSRASLEEVFLKYTGEDVRNEGPTALGMTGVATATLGVGHNE